jgi:hypothetical protein
MTDSVVSAATGPPGRRECRPAERVAHIEGVLNPTSPMAVSEPSARSEPRSLSSRQERADRPKPGRRAGRAGLDFSGSEEPSSRRGDTIGVTGRIAWDSGPEARARLVAQGEALQALLRAAGLSEGADADRE